MLTSGAKDFVYDGEWRDDKRMGSGNCVIRGRETYSGQWKDGLFHGRGLHCDAKGNVYDGEVGFLFLFIIIFLIYVSLFSECGDACMRVCAVLH